MLRFRRRDVKFVEQGNAKAFLKRLVRRGYIGRDGIYYVVLKEAIEGKRYFERYVKDMEDNNRVWR